jgi:hypothetical protein
MVIRRAGDPPRSPPTTPRTAPRAQRPTRARAADPTAHAGLTDTVDRLESIAAGAGAGGEHPPLPDVSGEPQPRPDLARLRVAEALERAQRRVAVEVSVLIDTSASAERRRRAWRALERVRHALSAARARAARAQRAASAEAWGLARFGTSETHAALETAIDAAFAADDDAPPHRRARATLALVLDHAGALDAGTRDGLVADVSAALVASPSARAPTPAFEPPSAPAPASALARLAALLGVAPVEAARAPAPDADAEEGPP